MLVADGGPGGHLAGVAVRGQSCDLQLRVERVTGVDLAKELAADAGEGDEDVADVLREQGRSGRGEGQHLQAVDDRRDMAVAAGVVDVVVDRMVVGGDCLERRGVGVGQGPAGRPEDVPTLRSSNALGSTTVKAAGSNWSGPEAAGWVMAGARYGEMEWDNRCLRSRRLPVQRSGHPAAWADWRGGLVIRLTRRWTWGDQYGCGHRDDPGDGEGGEPGRRQVRCESEPDNRLDQRHRQRYHDGRDRGGQQRCIPGVNTPGRSLGFSRMGPVHEFRCLRMAMPADFRGLPHLLNPSRGE